MGNGASTSAKYSADQFKELAKDRYSDLLYSKVKAGDGTVSGEAIDKFAKQATDVFLSHDWGKDTLGRNNHSRVVRLSAALKERGIVTWLDEEAMEGDIQAKMAEGIEMTSAVVVFVTENYIKKANGDGQKGELDNCYFEFAQANRTKGPGKMIPVVMEAGCLDTSKWHGKVGASLGGILYANYSKDDNFDKLVDDVYKKIVKIIKTPIRQLMGLDPPGDPSSPKKANNTTSEEFVMDPDRLEEMQEQHDEFGFKAAQLLKNGFTIKEIKSQDWFSLVEMRQAGCSFAGMVGAGYDPVDVSAAGWVVSSRDQMSLIENGMKPDRYLALGMNVLTDVVWAAFFEHGSTLAELTVVNYTPRSAAIWLNVAESKKYSLSELLAYGMRVTSDAMWLRLFELGYSIEELKTCEYTPKSEEAWKQLSLKGFSVEDMKSAGCAGYILRSAFDVSKKDLKAMGLKGSDLNTAAEMRDKGGTLPQLIAAGYRDTELSAAGFDNPQLVQAGFRDPDAGTYTLVRELSGQDSVYSLALLLDGKVAGGCSEAVKVYDIETGNCTATLPCSSCRYVRCLQELPNGRLASAGNDNKVHIWDIQQSKETRVFNLGYEVHALCQLADGRLATGCENKNVRLWNVDTGELKGTLSGHSYKILSLCLLPDGNLASGDFFHTLKIWNVDELSCRITMNTNNDIYSLLVLPDGMLAAGESGNGSVSIWNPDTGEPVCRLSSDSGVVNKMCNLKNGQLAVMRNTKQVYFFDGVTRSYLATLSTSSIPTSMVPMPDGGFIVCDGGKLVLYSFAKS